MKIKVYCLFIKINIGLSQKIFQFASIDNSRVSRLLLKQAIRYLFCCCLPRRACGVQRLRQLPTIQAKAPGSQPGRPFAPGQLCLSHRSVAEGKMMSVIMQQGGGGHWRQCNGFPGICLTTEENSRKPKLGNHCGLLVA